MYVYNLDLRRKKNRCGVSKRRRLMLVNSHRRDDGMRSPLKYENRPLYCHLCYASDVLRCFMLESYVRRHTQCQIHAYVPTYIHTMYVCMCMIYVRNEVNLNATNARTENHTTRAGIDALQKRQSFGFAFSLYSYTPFIYL
jgi:hypothetical protein